MDWGVEFLTRIDLLLGIALAAGGVLWGFYRYLRQRREETSIRIGETLLELESRFTNLEIRPQVDPSTGIGEQLREAVDKSIRDLRRTAEETGLLMKLDEFLRFLLLMSGLEKYRLLRTDAIAYMFQYWFTALLEDRWLSAYVAKYFKNLNRFLNDKAPEFLTGFKPDRGLQLRSGDIFLSRNRRWLSRAIRFCTRRIGEPRSVVSHVGIVVEGGALESTVIVEALSQVKKRKLVEAYGQGKDDLAVYRPINLTEAEVKAVVAAARAYEGRKYGVLKIVLHFLDWLLQGVYFFRALAWMDSYPICSWLVAQSFAKAGKTFGVAAGAATPDDIWDFVTDRPTKYERIRPLARFGGDD